MKTFGLLSVISLILYILIYIFWEDYNKIIAYILFIIIMILFGIAISVKNKLNDTFNIGEHQEDSNINWKELEEIDLKEKNKII